MVVDPGPDDPAHVDAMLAGLADETVTHLLVTHTHADHSPATSTVAHNVASSDLTALWAPGRTHVIVDARPRRPGASARRGASSRAVADATRDAPAGHPHPVTPTTPASPPVDGGAVHRSPDHV